MELQESMADRAAYASRLSRLRGLLSDLGVDSLLVSQHENRVYLSGFTGSAGLLLIAGDQAFIATDFRYYEQVAQESPDFELVPVRTRILDVLPELLQRAGVKCVAFEADHATYADVQSWREAAQQVEWIPKQGIVAALRAIKDDGELATLRAAIALGDEALVYGLAQARPGMTESELAWLIEGYMRTHGANGAAFDIIVACGPNGARPHARASNAILEAGQPIVIDMGAKVRGYHSDLTRTVCLGEPRDAGRFWEIYNTVLRAQLAAEAAIRPGMSGPEADAVARDLIAAAGYGDYFGHGLGHGVGLQIHEQPWLGRTSASTLKRGMVVTLEPGIYIPGWGGVRIEDIILVTGNGAEVLTGAPKAPII